MTSLSPVRGEKSRAGGRRGSSLLVRNFVSRPKSFFASFALTFFCRIAPCEMEENRSGTRTGANRMSTERPRLAVRLAIAAFVAIGLSSLARGQTYEVLHAFT